MKKSTIISIIVFVVLVGLYALISLTSKGGKTTTVESDVLELDSTKVEYIELSSPLARVVLEKKGDTWMITQPEEFEANAEMVKKLISETAHSSVDNIISENPDKHALFQVDTISGTKALIKESGGGSTEFIVGKMGPNYNTTYLREPGSDMVYLVEGRLTQLYKSQPNNWQNKDIVKVEKANIEQVVLHQPEGSVKLTKQVIADTLPSVWLAEDLKTNNVITADPQQVDRLLNGLARLKTNDFITASDSAEVPYDFEEPQFRVEITMDDGSFIGLSGIPQDEEGNRFVVKRDDKDVLYSLYKGSTQRFFKTANDFVMQTPSPETGALQPTINVPQTVPLNVTPHPQGE